MRHSILIVTLLSLTIVALSAQERPYGKRIQSSHSQYEDSMFAQASETYGTYYYSSDNTAFFDSITYVHSTSDYWLWGLCYDYTYKYRHNVYYQDGNEYAEHHEYPAHHEFIYITTHVRNTNNQIIEHRRRKVNANGTPGGSWFRLLHYNSFGKPDSIYYESSSYSTITKRYYLFEYDDLHRISQVTIYTLNNDIWSASNRTVHHYLNDVVPYPATLRFIDYCYYSVTGDLQSLLYVCDMDYPPQTIDVERWNGSAWIPDQQTYYVNANNSTGLVSISIQDDYYYGSVLTYRFSLTTGLYRGSYSSGGGGESWGSTTITWEDYVANQDDYLPETAAAILLTAYPNPFKNNLIINTKDYSLENISIYNIKGQLVRSWKDVKSNELTWDGKDQNNKPVKSGVYMIRARQGMHSSTIKIVKY